MQDNIQFSISCTMGETLALEISMEAARQRVHSYIDGVCLWASKEYDQRLTFRDKRFDFQQRIIVAECIKNQRFRNGIKFEDSIILTHNKMGNKGHFKMQMDY